MVIYLIISIYMSRLKVHRVLVKDKQRHIAYLKELVKIIITDKRKEMLQSDQVAELENVRKIFIS